MRRAYRQESYEQEEEDEAPYFVHSRSSNYRPHHHSTRQQQPHGFISISLTIGGSSPRFHEISHTSSFPSVRGRRGSDSSLSYEEQGSDESSPALEMELQERQSYFGNFGQPDSEDSQWDDNRESPFFAAAREGMTEVEIAGLPSMRWGRNHERFNRGEKCSVCMEQFEVGQMMRVMPSCLHRYHALCLDPWLKLRASCPICRTNCTVQPQTS